MTGLSISRALAFAERIIDKYRPNAGYQTGGTQRVFVKDEKTTTSIINTASHLWLKLYLGITANAPVTKQVQIDRNLIGFKIANHFKKEADLFSEKYLNREFQVFHSISTIFVNRERQPDQARKAEQKLIRILADDFFGRSEMIRDERYHIRRETTEEMKNTRRLVEDITRRVTVQEKVVKEIKKVTDEGPVIKPEQVDGIVKTVMKKMEQKLHLEKLRHGL